MGFLSYTVTGGWSKLCADGFSAVATQAPAAVPDEIFNFANHSNLANPGLTVGTGNFGKIASKAD